MWFDTHCHLDAPEFDADRGAMIARAEAAGVSRLLLPAVGVATLAQVDTLCSTISGCHAAYGIHPLYVDQASEADLRTLRGAVSARRPLAIGEIGLDGFAPGADPVRQEFFFSEQLKIARDFDLPVVLHIRRAQDRVLKFLRRFGVRGGFAHAFNGSRQQADAFIALGCKLGFGGAMTFPGSRRIREHASSLPLETLVLETDSPDIPPAWLAGGRNEPSELPRIAAVLAELRGESLDRIASTTCRNACEVLALEF